MKTSNDDCVGIRGNTEQYKQIAKCTQSTQCCSAWPQPRTFMRVPDSCSIFRACYSMGAAEEDKIESSSFLVCVLRGVQKSHDFEFELDCKLNPFLYSTENPMYIFLALGCQEGLPQDTLFRTYKYKGFSKFIMGNFV